MAGFPRFSDRVGGVVQSTAPRYFTARGGGEADGWAGLTMVPLGPTGQPLVRRTVLGLTGTPVTRRRAPTGWTPPPVGTSTVVLQVYEGETLRLQRTWEPGTVWELAVAGWTPAEIASVTDWSAIRYQIAVTGEQVGLANVELTS